MRDIYLYEDTDVLKNLLGIRDRKLLEEAEADYVTYRLKEIALNPLQGSFDYAHLLQMHKYIFQDMYDWAGQQRKINIYKEEPVLGGLSVEYSDIFDIQRDFNSSNLADFAELESALKKEQEEKLLANTDFWDKAKDNVTVTLDGLLNASEKLDDYQIKYKWKSY